MNTSVSSAKSLFVRKRRQKRKEKSFHLLLFCVLRVLRVLRERLCLRVDDLNMAPLEQPT